MTDQALIGHTGQWAGLQRAVQRGRIPQTLIISGAPGSGKMTLALRLGGLLLCQDPQDQEPCGNCRACHLLAGGNHPDFLVYRPLVAPENDPEKWVVAPEILEGSVFTIDQARRVGEDAQRRPLLGQRRVIVLNQIERATIDAQNALLKTLEEPVQGLSLLLLTANPNHLLPTIHSRAWHLPLSLVPDAMIIAWLRGLFPETGEETLLAAVQTARGRPGAAWRALRMPSGAGRQQEVQQMLGLIGSRQVVACLALTERTLSLGHTWWDEEIALEPDMDLRRGESKVVRSGVALVLDQLAAAYRATLSVPGGTVGVAPEGAAGVAAVAGALDQITKTRQYVLRNANTALALDVLYGRLIRLQA